MYKIRRKYILFFYITLYGQSLYSAESSAESSSRPIQAFKGQRIEKKEQKVTKLLQAAEYEGWREVREALKLEFNPTIQNKFGKLSLKPFHPDADPTVQDALGRTPLIIATEKNDIFKVAEIVRGFSDEKIGQESENTRFSKIFNQSFLNKTDNSGRTAVFIAAENAATKQTHGLVLKALIGAKADIDQPKVNGKSARELIMSNPKKFDQRTWQAIEELMLAK